MSLCGKKWLAWDDSFWITGGEMIKKVSLQPVPHLNWPSILGSGRLIGCFEGSAGKNVGTLEVRPNMRCQGSLYCVQKMPIKKRNTINCYFLYQIKDVRPMQKLYMAHFTSNRKWWPLIKWPQNQPSMPEQSQYDKLVNFIATMPIKTGQWNILWKCIIRLVNGGDLFKCEPYVPYRFEWTEWC